MVTTLPVSAWRIMIGATPAKLIISLWTTSSAKPPATPASTTLPPASSTWNAAWAAR